MISESIPGDGLDNDCDDKFDEEIRDGKDNDGDGRIDEDLQLVNKVIHVVQIVRINSLKAILRCNNIFRPSVQENRAKAK